MIGHVGFDGTTFADLPFKFEAGTPDFVGIAALHTAINWLEDTGIGAIAQHEHNLMEHTMAGLEEIPGIRFFGTAPARRPSFRSLSGTSIRMTWACSWTSSG